MFKGWLEVSLKLCCVKLILTPVAYGILLHECKIITGMLITALFDREVNCRRAAAAAFQVCLRCIGWIYVSRSTRGGLVDKNTVV